MRDELGLDYTSSHGDSTVIFNQALTRYLASDATSMAHLEELLSQDPEMPMAMMFRAYLLKLAADPRFKVTVDQCVDALAKRTGLNAREKLHREALELWRDNQLEQAVQAFDNLICLYPKDMLAIRVAHYLHFYGQGGNAMISSLAEVVRSWQPDEPFYGYLKGMECFALEELGKYAEAELAGREALEINPADIWAAHAVAHIMQMQARFNEGVSFIDSLKAKWRDANNFVNHMHWHQALQYIGLGQSDEALRIYDELLIGPIKDDFYLDVCNSASLLWRLTMLGVDIGKRWQNLHEISRRRVEDDELVFSTLHYLMAPAVLGDEDAMKRCLNSIENWSARPGTQSLVCRNVGMALAEAICQLGRGESEAAARQMASIQPQISQIGGSYAQRHLFDQMIEHYA